MPASASAAYRYTPHTLSMTTHCRYKGTAAVAAAASGDQVHPGGAGSGPLASRQARAGTGSVRRPPVQPRSRTTRDGAAVDAARLRCRVLRRRREDCRRTRHHRRRSPLGTGSLREVATMGVPSSTVAGAGAATADQAWAAADGRGMACAGAPSHPCTRAQRSAHQVVACSSTLYRHSEVELRRRHVAAVVRSGECAGCAARAEAAAVGGRRRLEGCRAASSVRCGSKRCLRLRTSFLCRAIRCGGREWKWAVIHVEFDSQTVLGTKK